MATSGGVVYLGPTGTTPITNPLVSGTVYQNLLSTPIHVSVTSVLTVATTGDGAYISIGIGSTSGGIVVYQRQGLSTESLTGGQSLEASIFQVVPAGWYYRYILTLAGGGAASGQSALALT